MSRLVSDGESQAQPRILIDGTTPVLAAHSTDGGETCIDKVTGEGKCILFGYYLHQGSS